MIGIVRVRSVSGRPTKYVWLEVYKFPLIYTFEIFSLGFWTFDKVTLTKNPDPWLWSFVYLADSLVTVFSFGYFETDWPERLWRRNARRKDI